MDEKTRVGFAMTGSYCTFDKVLKEAEALSQIYTLIPILSEHVTETDSRFGTAAAFRNRLEMAAGREAITAIPEAEPIGPRKLLDVLVIAPCTGNTIAKLAHGIADTTVTLAAKSHLRNGRPVVLAVSTNDGLGANAGNIGKLMGRKQIYFVPFYQDDPREKPNSLVAEFGLIGDTVEHALRGRQIQPVLLPWNGK
jgi:dipicolinate synthase subunit B